MVARVTKRARNTRESLVFVHSHPFGLNQFSVVDDEGERVLAEFFERRTPTMIHAAMLVTPEVTIARVLGSGSPLGVVGGDEFIDILKSTTPDALFGDLGC